MSALHTQGDLSLAPLSRGLLQYSSKSSQKWRREHQVNTQNGVDGTNCLTRSVEGFWRTKNAVPAYTEAGTTWMHITRTTGGKFASFGRRSAAEWWELQGYRQELPDERMWKDRKVVAALRQSSERRGECRRWRCLNTPADEMVQITSDKSSSDGLLHIRQPKKLECDYP